MAGVIGVGAVILIIALANMSSDTNENANRANANRLGNRNANANTTVASNTTLPGADNSEISTATDASGVKTETRVFHNNPRVSKVVVTTRDGRRSTTVYAPSGESRELNKNEPEDVLEATGSAIADAAGFVADKTVVGAKAVGEGAKTVGEKTVEGAKTVGEKTKEGAEKTKEGAEKVAEKTKEGLSKTGEVITDGWITTRVHSKFVGEDLLKDSDINVDTNDHVVTLKGTVMSAAGRARAVAQAKEVEGVHKVVDLLTIGPKKP